MTTTLRAYQVAIKAADLLNDDGLAATVGARRGRADTVAGGHRADIRERDGDLTYRLDAGESRPLTGDISAAARTVADALHRLAGRART